MPPDFCADASPATSRQATAPSTASFDLIPSSFIAPVLYRLSVEPNVFVSRSIVDAVDHDGQPLHLRIPAGGRAVVIDHWAGAVLLQFFVDLPHQRLALFGIGFQRMPVALSFGLRVPIAGVVAVCAARA